MGVTLRIPSKPELFVLSLPSYITPSSGRDIRHHSCVCMTFTLRTFFFSPIQRIVINKQKRQRTMFIQPSYMGNDVRTNTRTSAQPGLTMPSSRKSGSTAPPPEMISPPSA